MNGSLPRDLKSRGVGVHRGVGVNRGVDVYGG